MEDQMKNTVNMFAPTDCPFYLVTRASLALTGVMKQALARHELADIKPAYLSVLMCLWAVEGMDEMLGKLGRDDGMKLTELGRCAGLEPSTMTGLIDRMERDGLVTRVSDPHDRRAQKAALTERGAQVQACVSAAVDDMFQQAFDGIKPTEMKTVKKVLQIILANANKGAAKNGN